MRARLFLLALVAAMFLGVERWAQEGSGRQGQPPAAAHAPPAVAGAGGGLQPELALPEARGEITQEIPVPARTMALGQPGVVHLVLERASVRPALVEAERNGRVRLLVSNHSDWPRNLVIPDFHIVGRVLSPGDENYIEFTADAAGDFAMYSDASSPGTPEPGTLAVLRVR